MKLVDEFTIMDGEFVLRIVDLEEEGNGGYEFHIEDVAYDDITTFPEKHILYPVYFAQFYALRRAHEAYNGEKEKLRRYPLVDLEDLEYFDDMISGLEQSFKAVFKQWREIR